MTKRIHSNFYTVKRVVWTKDGYEYKSLPDGRLYSGNSTQYPTNITADDLPESFVRIDNRYKNGWLNTAGVKSVVFVKSIFSNHWLRDANLYISYLDDDPADFKEILKNKANYLLFDEKNYSYVFENEILVALKGISIYSPNVDLKETIQEIIDGYNIYADDWNACYDRKSQRLEHIRSLDRYLDPIYLETGGQLIDG